MNNARRLFAGFFLSRTHAFETHLSENRVEPYR